MPFPPRVWTLAAWTRRKTLWGACTTTHAAEARIVREKDLLEYFRKRKAGPRTNNLDRVLLRAFFKWAMKHGYAETNPAADLRAWEQPRRESRALAAEEVAALLRACREEYKVEGISGKRNVGGVEGGETREAAQEWSQTFNPPPGLYPAVVLALTSLLRLGNVLGLRWRDLDLGRDEIRVPAERVKTRVELVLPLAPSAKRAILELPKGGADDLVFGVGEIKKPFGSAVKRAGLRDVTFHALRRTGATYLRERGVPLEVAMHLGGWSTGANVMLKPYRGVGMEEFRKAVGVLDRLVSGRSEGDAAARQVS